MLLSFANLLPMLSTDDLEKEKREYELTAVLNSEAAESELVSVLGQHDCEVLEKKNPVQLRLAYPIKKQTSGYLSVVYLRCFPEAIQKLKENLYLKPEVLRFLIVTPPIRPQAANHRSDRQSRPAAVPPESKPAPAAEILSNEALEEKLEEILK